MSSNTLFGRVAVRICQRKTGDFIIGAVRSNMAFKTNRRKECHGKNVAGPRCCGRSTGFNDTVIAIFVHVSIR